MRIKRDIINKFKEWKDAENPCRGRGRKLCQWKKYCCVQRTLPTQEPHTFLNLQQNCGMLACPSPLAEWAMKWLNK